MAQIGTGLLGNVQLTVTTLVTLASATYCAQTGNLYHGANNPLDVLVDVSVTTTNTPAGNKQVLVFAKGSVDGVNYTTGPESGTTTTDEPDLHFVGVVPVYTASTAHRKLFSLANAFGGVLPLYSRLVFKNDLGVALTAASVQYAEVLGSTS